MKQYLNQINIKIKEIITQSKSEILKNKMNKFSSIIILDVYHRDIIESFILNK